MKHRITAAVMSLCLSLCVLLGGCNISINVGDSSSGNPLQTLSGLASDIKSGLKELEISENTILHTLTVKNAKEPMNQFYICWPKKSSKKQAE